MAMPALSEREEPDMHPALALSEAERAGSVGAYDARFGEMDKCLWRIGGGIESNSRAVRKPAP